MALYPPRKLGARSKTLGLRAAERVRLRPGPSPVRLLNLVWDIGKNHYLRVLMRNMYICVCIIMYASIYAYMHAYTCMYVCMYVCMHVCIYVYIHREMCRTPQSGLACRVEAGDGGDGE